MKRWCIAWAECGSWSGCIWKGFLRDILVALRQKQIEMNARDAYGIRNRASTLHSPHTLRSRMPNISEYSVSKSHENIDGFGNRKRLRKQCSGTAPFCEIKFPKVFLSVR